MKARCRVSLEIPLLPASLKPLIERQAFSFAQFWRSNPTSLPERLDDVRHGWIKRVFRAWSVRRPTD